MKILLVTSVDPWTRSVSTIHRWVHAGRSLGHEVAVYGEPSAELPHLPFTTDLSGVNVAVFVVQVPSDFPDMPYLARVLDQVPRERRVVVDLWGRFNDTIRVDHDFNHLEKLDGHLGWEWEDAFNALSEVILQPTLAPRRPGVRSYLFHGFDPAAIAARHSSAREAAAAWSTKPYGVMYVGSNWQRWTQVRPFLERYAPVRDKVGPVCLVGWDWGARPDWAVQKGIVGVDTDPDFLAALGVEIRNGVRFDEIVGLLGQARFAPVFHRPLFRELGLVTARTFETFYADTIPVLMLPRDLVTGIYGPAASALVPGADLTAYLTDVLDRPQHYWEAVLETRAHLARQHSYERRLQELLALAAPKTRSGAAR
jgi:hypothetical protein